MKAIELRIGNYYNEFGIPKQVTASFIEKLDQIEKACKIVIDVSPIEITEDWLIKLGFKKDIETDYRWFILDKSVAYDLDDNCIRISDSWEFGKRKFVHELQNLYFALTSKELTFKQ